MPLVHGQEATPDDAMASGFCPECGKDLTVGNPAAHRRTHWMAAPPADASGDEARRRMTLYDAYLKEHPDKPADPTKPPAAPVNLRATHEEAKA
jgi:hypothetical protein